MKSRLQFLCVRAGAVVVSCAKKEKAPVFTAQEARAIVKDAYIYGFPIVDSYRVQYAYFVDPKDKEYKGGWNEIHGEARVYTPADKAIQTPNSDTPYSILGADLRTEPVVITIPDIDAKRYYSLQFIDLYTHNFAYAGSRSTGTSAANFLLAGPKWKGATPPGINAVFHCETEFASVIFRTQLFNKDDLKNVKKIQDGYRVHTLSQFLGKPAPSAAPLIEFAKPLSAADERSSPAFFKILNFVLQFCPTDSSETALMARFAKVNIGAGKTFDDATMSRDMQQAVVDGMSDAWSACNAVTAQLAAGTVTSGDLFGTRAYLKNNYAYRMAAAVTGIYGNSKEEAIYPVYKTDSAGAPLDGSHEYVLHFAKDQFPPVNAFWSVTMYEMPASLLYDNPIDRYLINSSMLPKLQKDKDGGITIYVSHPSPGPKLQSNWLPAPGGAFMMAMRLYWPKPEALDGTWKAPPLTKVD
jgi:hypothetical protein